MLCCSNGTPISSADMQGLKQGQPWHRHGLQPGQAVKTVVPVRLCCASAALAGVYEQGVLSPEDAQLALDHGVDGIIVSNHGECLRSGPAPLVRALSAASFGASNLR